MERIEKYRIAWLEDRRVNGNKGRVSHRIGKKERDEIFSLTRAVYIRRDTRNARNLATLNAETINCLQLIIIGESSFINITITLRFCSLCTSRLTRVSSYSPP